MKVEYIIKRKNGNVLYHGHSNNYAWRKFYGICKKCGNGIITRRSKFMIDRYLSNKDGREHQIGAFGKCIVGDDQYELALFLIVG